MQSTQAQIRQHCPGGKVSLARSGTQPPVVTGDDNHSQPAQLRSILGRHQDSNPPGRARPKAVARVDLAKNGVANINCRCKLVFRQTGSARAVSHPNEGSRVTAEGIQPQLNGAVCKARVLYPA